MHHDEQRQTLEVRRRAGRSAAVHGGAAGGSRDDWRPTVGILRRKGSEPIQHGGLSERQATVRRMQRSACEILSCLDLGTMASEDLCSEGGHSSGRLSEASQL